VAGPAATVVDVVVVVGRVVVVVARRVVGGAVSGATAVVETASVELVASSPDEHAAASHDTITVTATRRLRVDPLTFLPATAGDDTRPHPTMGLSGTTV
jgi:hypothetical protein